MVSWVSFLYKISFLFSFFLVKIPFCEISILKKFLFIKFPFEKFFFCKIPFFKKLLYDKDRSVGSYNYQNPREASSWSRILLISLEYVCIYLCMYLFIYLCHTSGPKENRYRPENWHINSQWPYLKTVIFFFEKITMRAACLKKLPCHVDFPHISSIAFFHIILFRVLGSDCCKFHLRRSVAFAHKHTHSSKHT